MSDEPELKSVQQSSSINPLMIAWATVLILLGSTVAWVTLSSDPVEQPNPIQVSSPAQTPVETSLADNSDLTPNIANDQENITDDMPIEAITPPKLILMNKKLFSHKYL